MAIILLDFDSIIRHLSDSNNRSKE